MTVILIHLCGAAGAPWDELEGRTVLEAANPPAFQEVGIQGALGTVLLVPEGLFPEAGVEALALLGYEVPRETGLGALEALGAGVALGARDAAFRVNLVATDGERLLDARAGRIEHERACQLMEEVDRRLSTHRLKFYPGRSHAHVMVWTDGPLFALCTPAPEAEGRRLGDVLPAGDGEVALRQLIWDSYQILDPLPYNERQRGEGLVPANMIWPWAPSRAPALRPLALRAHLRCHLWASRLSVLGAAEAVQVPASPLPPTLEATVEALRSRLPELDLAYVQLDLVHWVREERDPMEWVQAVRTIADELLEPVRAHVSSQSGRARLLLVATEAEGQADTEREALWAAYPAPRSRPTDAGEFTERAARELGTRVDEGFRLLELVSKE